MRLALPGPDQPAGGDGPLPAPGVDDAPAVREHLRHELLQARQERPLRVVLDDVLAQLGELPGDLSRRGLIGIEVAHVAGDDVAAVAGFDALDQGKQALEPPHRFVRGVRLGMHALAFVELGVDHQGDGREDDQPQGRARQDDPRERPR